MASDNKSSGMVWGAILILIGVLFLFQNFDMLDIGDIISTFWPLVLVAIGLKILYDRKSKNEDDFDFIVFPDSLQKRLSSFCKTGGNLFISGAYVGTDVFNNAPIDSMDIKFARGTLKYFHRTNYAAKNGNVFVCFFDKNRSKTWVLNTSLDARWSVLTLLLPNFIDNKGQHHFWREDINRSSQT